MLSYVTAAKDIAKQAHFGQTRRDKVTPYIVHPEAVAEGFDKNIEPEECAAAWLHDTLEDTYITADYLLKAGIPQNVVQAVIVLTKQEGQDYFEYLKGVKNNAIARRVKIQDINCNLNDTPTNKQKIKYQQALQFLNS